MFAQDCPVCVPNCLYHAAKKIQEFSSFNKFRYSTFAECFLKKMRRCHRALCIGRIGCTVPVNEWRRTEKVDGEIKLEPHSSQSSHSAALSSPGFSSDSENGIHPTKSLCEQEVLTSESSSSRIKLRPSFGAPF
jgi:hypothetical protein